MPTFTQANLDAVNAAIVALATGQKAVKVTIRDKTIEYHQASLADLQALRDTIAADLGQLITRRYAGNAGGCL